MGQGLTIDRRFTTEGQDVYESVEWSSRDSRITNPDGSIVFEMLGAEIPAQWSQVAADIMVSKYFRKAGVPQYDAAGNAVLDDEGNPVTGSETSARQVIKRLASTWRWWGETNEYFASDNDAAAFEDELAYMLLHQMAAPNSPQWFNTGLNHEYGITGSEQGFWFVDPATEEVTASKDAYTRPAPHACFPEGTRITTREGFKPIEKIEPGDMVLTHQGRYRPVTDTMQRQVEEELVRVRVTKLTASELVATANHPILSLRKGGSTPSWINAGDLRKADYVVVAAPKPDGVVPEKNVDLAAGLSSNYEVDDTTITTRNSAHRPTMQRYLDLNNPSAMRLLGRWLGDGSVLHESRDGSISGVGLVFNADDSAGMADTAELMEQLFGVSTSTEFAKGQNTAHLRFMRRPIGEWFSATFGEGFAGKSIPDWVYALPAQHRIQFLAGLFAADGCVHKVGSFLGFNFDHSNKDLAEGVWRLARSLGYAPSISGGDVRPGGTAPHYRVQISARDGVELAAVCGLTVDGESRGRELRLEDGAIAYPIAETSQEPFYGTVYNFQVEEDESYIADGVAVHNCFINSVDDDLVNEGGIMDLWVREARLFKMGAGSGANFSHIRAEGEQLSGGGKSSGLMSFLKVGDRAAGAIKSGGTTRRAAKMVIVDIDHPDVETFIAWKAEEEKKVRALVAGGYSSDFNGEAYATVAGQNSNNSVRLSNEFLNAVVNDKDWDLTARTDGSVMKTLKARDLWHQISDAAWQSADPGLQFHGTINEWHTSPAEGEIRASNPCFTGDTRIATDKGLIQFKDLVTRSAAGETFDVFTHDATNLNNPSETVSLSSPTQIMVTGANEILRLEFSDGREIRCTPNHRFWTHNRGWVRADELADDDRMRLLDREIDFGMASWAIPVSSDVNSYQKQTSRKYAVNLPEKWTEDFAHYMGWLIGDGSLTNAAAVTVYGTEEEQQSTMVVHQALLAEINGGVAPKPTRMRNGTYQLRVTRNATRRFLEALGVSREKSPSKRVPWAVFEAPKTIVAAFLRGLYDADGCVVNSGDKNRYVGLGSTSSGLLRDVQQLLDTFSVRGRIYTTRQADTKRGFEYTTKSGQKKKYSSSTMHDLRVTGSVLDAFAAEIGFELSYKQDILDQMMVETTRYSTRDWTRLKSRTEAGFETTYNLTEPTNHSYLAHGVCVSNCSEYLFLDNTACNLASLNLGKFYDGHTGSFDIPSYQHATRLWTIVLEISVTMAQFPSKEIAIGSYDYRTLGLGYANLGSLLMRMGIPYDSEHGRGIAGALTAILTGYSYATSAEMAAVLGPFPKYSLNRDSMLRVIRNHRRATYNKDAGDYEGVSHFVMGIDAGLTPLDMLEAARTAWDTALTRGEQHGFRNAQVSVLAPTGTIGLLMDCDTTGVEPDFSLVKFKKLAGGGYFKIANQSIAPALQRLGYSDNTVQRIIEYVVGTNSLARSPHVNMATLIAKGFTADDLDKIEEILPGVFEIGFAFNQWTLGEDVMQRLGFTPEQYTAPEFSMLKALGFTDSEIQDANDYICGRQTIEGAPHLRDEHLAVFDTANRNGRFGERYIYHTGHINMMAAAQPFISGAISKTTNMPNEVTREDIEEAYRLSWELGLKAMAIYRDGSKASQPLSSQSDDGYADDEPAELEDALVDEIELVSHGRVPWHEAIKPGMSPAMAYADMKRPRFLLPSRRAGYTQEARVGGHKVFLRTGEYEDGSLGELFIDLAKEGATLRGILSCFAIAVSKGLQYGVPLEEFVDTFTFQTFEPRGMVEGHPNIKMANSLIDYVFRALGVEYLHRDELAQVPPDRRSELPEPPKGLAVDAGIQLDLRDAAAETAVNATVEAAAFVDAEVIAPVDNAPVIETSQDSYRNSGAMSVTPKPAGSNGGAVATVTAAEIQQQAMQASMADKMGDAPICETCGAITVRNGSCYVCLGCGGTTGCS